LIGSLVLTHPVVPGEDDTTIAMIESDPSEGRRYPKTKASESATRSSRSGRTDPFNLIKTAPGGTRHFSRISRDDSLRTPSASIRLETSGRLMWTSVGTRLSIAPPRTAVSALSIPLLYYLLYGRIKMMPRTPSGTSHASPIRSRQTWPEAQRSSLDQLHGLRPTSPGLDAYTILKYKSWDTNRTTYQTPPNTSNSRSLNRSEPRRILERTR
jgi:hypothetical protein